MEAESNGAGGGNRTHTGGEPHGVLSSLAVFPTIRENRRKRSRDRHLAVPAPLREMRLDTRNTEAAGTAKGTGMTKRNVLASPPEPDLPWHRRLLAFYKAA